jgi:hypothetical protein
MRKKLAFSPIFAFFAVALPSDTAMNLWAIPTLRMSRVGDCERSESASQDRNFPRGVRWHADENVVLGKRVLTPFGDQTPQP